MQNNFIVNIKAIFDEKVEMVLFIHIIKIFMRMNLNKGLMLSWFDKNIFGFA